jgi:hypothetical protein
MVPTCKPNFFIAGMPRSGTTSLYTYLKQHPEIYLSIYKEPHFFGKDLTRNIYCIRDEEIYFGLFAGAGGKKRIGEASVWTLTSVTAAAEIHAFNPTAKIIIMLRNPLDMIYSLHSLYLRTKNEDIPDFQQALEKQADRMNGQAIPAGCYFPEGLFYLEVAKYYEKIKRFMDIFTRENLHIVIFNDFVKQTPRCYREILQFLQVDPNLETEFDIKKAAQVIRPKVLGQIRRGHPEVKKKLSSKTGPEAHQGPPRPPLPPALSLRLQRVFKDDIKKTSQLIGKDLMHWLELEVK